jgi:hypothetical protein
MSDITLLGSSNVEHRLQILSALYSHAEEKINHIDDSRQTNMNYALVIFAGLFGLGIGLNNLVYQLYISTTILIVMCIFCLWDRRLHELSHGWRSSSSTFRVKTSEVINNPDQDITFPHYRADDEKKAEWFSFQPMIFYTLVLGGLLSFFIFLCL